MTMKPHFSETQNDREYGRVKCNILGGLFNVLIFMSEYALCSDNYIFVARGGTFLKFGQYLDEYFIKKTLKISYKSHVAHCS